MQLMDQKIRYEIEFPINSSPQLLYQYIWPWDFRIGFDNVNSRGEFFYFHWDSEEKTRLASKKSGKVKFKWVDDKIRH
jgi:hypothetical protein